LPVSDFQNHEKSGPFRHQDPFQKRHRLIGSIDY